MNKKEKNNCHYRDCEAITDNLSRIKNKRINVIARSAQVRTSSDLRIYLPLASKASSYKRLKMLFITQMAKFSYRAGKRQ